MLCMLTTKFRCLQEIPPSDPIDQGNEGDWDMVGEPAGASRSLAPTVEELVVQLTRQAPVAEGSTEPAVLLRKSQRLLRPKRRRLLRLDWSTSPASSAPQL
jgi:hypothetical protein